MKKLLAVALLGFVAGCSSLQDNQPTAQLITQYAVVKYAERLPAESRQSRVERIREIATAVKGLASAETSLMLLREAVASQLDKAGLSPADRLLADGLVQLITADLQRRIGDGVLSAEQRVQISAVMDWIIAATQLV